MTDERIVEGLKSQFESHRLVFGMIQNMNLKMTLIRLILQALKN